MRYVLFFMLILPCALWGQRPPLKQYNIGDLAFGGIVFYVEKIGGDGLQRGLVCSPEDLSRRARWNANDYVITRAAFPGKFARFNSRMILERQGWGDSTNAAAVCDFYKPGEGWYLPSVDELNLIYLNLYRHSTALRRKANFRSNPGGYWSSTELSTDSSLVVSDTEAEQSAWIVNFYGSPGVIPPKNTAGPATNNKRNRLHVRAVKEFRNDRRE
jgi:hypothetical protein